METTSRGGASAPSGERNEPQAGTRPIDGYLLAGFPWYGLDAAYDGERWLTQAGFSAEGTVEHGALGHGDRPSLMAALPMADPEAERQRFAVVVTLGDRPVRTSADGTGTLEATSVSSAAWLAGSGLLSSTWPGRMDRALRSDWLEQQTAIAWELADDLDGDAWTTLSLPVDDVPTPFRYRESEYGWVLAGSVEGAHLGGYGRGMSAYGLALARVKDLTAYDATL
ncbi:hypothetical protein POF50_013985 [Streptomyces sp. SL13]|jgi:hypothetical protein|uniref:Uncharacterized protein n=1 Tax=Streptantibioticus silvisoli TaxID=2705255 RepID=A0AA90K8W7_9ACTN|nr:hypothetical protein [Streptantibioticus silvisoli]MDI5963889.1 hypothetical protein [Streptantibioticus silvisoli]MDI5970438.1 hypothetical protein [Streptantibioticus silvisoli]